MKYFIMAEYTHDSSVQSVKYKKIKNENGDEDATDMFLRPNCEIDTSSKTGRNNQFYSIRNYVISVIFISTVIFIVILYALYYHSNIYSLSNSETANNSIFKIQNNGRGNISCVPVVNVKYISIVSKVISSYSCYDKTSCQTFLKEIEEDHGGLNTSFVIGSRGELYIGSGFKCLVNSNESVLYIKILKFNDTPEEYLNWCLRLSEIINHGVLCGKVSTDFTLIYMANDEVYHSKGRLPFSCRIESDKHRNKFYHFHDNDHQLRTLLHRDFRWTVCGNYSKSTQVKETKVITFDSILKESCKPLQPVTEIIIDIVETTPSNCSDSFTCVQIFEENHNGLKYNFIIGHNLEVYVGLGFRCRANNSYDNILRVKVLEPYNYNCEYLYWERIRILQIILEGLVCKTINENFSVKITCNYDSECYLREYCKTFFKYLENRSSIIHLLTIRDEIFETYEYYNITSESGRGIIPKNFRHKACHKEDFSHSSSITKVKEPSASSSVETSDEKDIDSIKPQNEDTVIHTTISKQPSDEATLYSVIYSTTTMTPSDETVTRSSDSEDYEIQYAYSEYY